jgi:tRNA pseudouridine65 synthase
MLPVLYRDDWLVAIHKPAGLLVHRSALDAGETHFALQMLRNQIGRRVWPAHRLDRGTSGVLLFALDEDASRALGAQFESRQVGKRYAAVVRGHPPESGEIDHPLSVLPEDRPFADFAELRQARTLYRRLATTELPYRVDRYPTSRYALLELEPLTGRRHQLRRHLKHVSHPIVGDASYGKGGHNRLFHTLLGCRRLLLACTELRLRHPVTGAPVIISAPLAEDFAKVVRRLDWAGSVPAGWLPQDQPFGSGTKRPPGNGCGSA